MKTKILMFTLALPALTATSVSADPNLTVVGSALGAVAGAVVANNVGGVSKFVAIPAGALLGGVIGNQYNQRQKDSYYVTDYGTKVVVVGQTTAGAPTVADPHPGVDLIKVSILNSNGIRTDVPILRVSGKFVGPQGETYATLPTSAEMARRYGI